MEKNQYRLCIEVLRRLDREGVLKDMVLVGSWCMPFYKNYFSGTAYSPSIKTRDVDFLVPKPSAMKPEVDLAALMKDLGFIKGFRGREGYMVLEHPELVIEFLVPEKGRGTDKPVRLPGLGFNAQALRFLDLLSRDTIDVDVEGVSVILPHPVNFALHKLIVSRRRGRKDKAEKDREAGLKILRALIEKKDQKALKRIFNSIPPKWRAAILKELDGEEEVLIKIASALRTSQ